MSIEVYPQKLRTNLENLNKKLEPISLKVGPLKSSISDFVETDDLEGVAFGSEKDYMSRGHLPAIDALFLSIRQFIAANDAHITCADSYLGGESHLSEDQLLQQIQVIQGLITIAENLQLDSVADNMRKLEREAQEKLNDLENFHIASTNLYAAASAELSKAEAYVEALRHATYDSSTGTFHLQLQSLPPVDGEISEAELIELLGETYGFSEDEIKLMLKLYKGLEEKHPDDAARLFFSLLGAICYGDESNGLKTQAAWFIIAEAYPNELVRSIMKDLGLTEEEFRTLEYAVIMQNAISGIEISADMSVEKYINGIIGKEDDKLGPQERRVKRLLMEDMEYRYGITYKELKKRSPSAASLLCQSLERFSGKGDFSHMCIAAATIQNTDDIKQLGNIAGIYNGIFDVDKNAGYVGDAYGTNGAPPSMGVDDYIADLDAVNISARIKNPGDNAIQVIGEYYSDINNGTSNRATEFLENIGDGSVEVGKSIIITEATEYLGQLNNSNLSDEAKEAYKSVIGEFIDNVLNENNTY